MIRYSLVCETGHDFESWFPSSAAFEAQRERGLLSCPVCDSVRVEKAPMAPSLGRKGNRGTTAVAPTTQGAPAAEAAPVSTPAALLSEQEQAVRAMLRAVREHVTRNADDVGFRFAEEARRMHYGEIEHRSIYGESDPGEVRALLEEGIEVHPLPRVPDDRN